MEAFALSLEAALIEIPLGFLFWEVIKQTRIADEQSIGIMTEAS